MWKDRRGFTGLEAAIVLTAFIVVAAVFSYMAIGAGFFTTEKAKEVVHTGVERATSSAELVGAVIGRGDGRVIQNISFTLQLTAGQHPLDLDRSVISFTNETIYNASVNWTREKLLDDDGGNPDNLLEAGEKVEIKVNLTNVSANVRGLYANDKFMLEFKPDAGGVLPIERRIPGAIHRVIWLY
ncbi:MAG: flagellin [Methanophagales archaeon]|nr:flagellin [Methanophagales archaeon]